MKKVVVCSRKIKRFTKYARRQIPEALFCVGIIVGGFLRGPPGKEVL